MPGNLSDLNWALLDEPPEPAPVPDQVREAMRGAGIDPPESISIDGRLHRFGTKENRLDDAGWYIIFPGEIAAGSFGDWRSSTSHNFRQDVGRQLSPAEKAALERHIAEAQAAREADLKRRHMEAAARASRIWDSARTAPADHPYLARKGIEAHGARVAPTGELILPIYSPAGELSSLQYIPKDEGAKKKFLSGGAVAGSLWAIGDLPAPRVYIAEGFATAASIREATGRPVVIAYSAGNLPAVAAQVRADLPTAELVIVADNDLPDKYGRKAGQEAAATAAERVGARVVIPPTPGQDANDFARAGGDLRGLLEPRASSFDRLGVVRLCDESDDFEPPDEIIQNLVSAGKLVVVYGASNSGKTFWVISMAVAISEGRPFHGRLVDGGPVVYIAAESPGGVRDRMKAYRRHFGGSLRNLYMVSVPVNFYDDAGAAAAIVELCRDIEAETGQRVRMVIGDTLARMSAGANENSGEDMGPVMASFDDISRETGAAIIVIHHSGKDQAKGARGWSGIQAHIDVEIEVQDQKGAKTATITKNRDGSKGDALGFKLVQIELGVGKFGDQKTTCVAMPDEDGCDPETDEEARYREECEDFYTIWEANGFPVGLQGRPQLENQMVGVFYMADMRDRPEPLKPETVESYLKPGDKGFFFREMKKRGRILASKGKIMVNDDGFSLELNNKRKGGKGDTACF